MNQILSRLIKVGGHILFWGVVFVVFCPEPLGLGAFSLKVFGQIETLWFFLYGFALNLCLFYGFYLYSIPRIPTQKWFPPLLLNNLVWLIGFVLVESVIDYFFAHRVLSYSVAPEGNGLGFRSLWNWMSTNFVVSGLVLIGANFYGFTSAWFRDRQVQRDLEQEKLRAELKALKHQVNPHFLFNVLNSLYALAFQNDDEPTAEGIAMLSQLMRYMLYESNDTEVLLEKEIAYLENYISLQKLRLNGKTVIRFDVEGEVRGKSIAPMLLIPFVENAFKFGISTARDSHVYIRLSEGEGKLQFWVNNSIHDVNTPVLDEFGGIGLDNVKKRLDLLYPGRYQLDFGPLGSEFEVTLTISI
ncbi:MAG: sensor histidine kinase [Bacteroidia bacterium]|nr:sensor histidine kinase [Bacteroidia bacterium]